MEDYSPRIILSRDLRTYGEGKPVNQEAKTFYLICVSNIRNQNIFGKILLYSDFLCKFIMPVFLSQLACRPLKIQRTRERPWEVWLSLPDVQERLIVWDICVHKPRTRCKDPYPLLQLCKTCLSPWQIPLIGSHPLDSV